MYFYEVTVGNDEAERLGQLVDLTVMYPLVEMFENSLAVKTQREKDRGRYYQYPNERKYLPYQALMDIWNAGRVQGIREERARRRKAK